MFGFGKNKKKGKIEKLVMGAIIGVAVGSVIGMAVAPRKDKKLLGGIGKLFFDRKLNKIKKEEEETNKTPEKELKKIPSEIK